MKKQLSILAVIALSLLLVKNIVLNAMLIDPLLDDNREIPPLHERIISAE